LARSVPIPFKNSMEVSSVNVLESKFSKCENTENLFK